MDDVSAGVVDDAPVVEESAAPEAERADGVGEDEPERGEGHPGLDVHAAQHGPRQEHERDGGELELEQHQRRLRVQRLGAGRALVRGGRQRRPADEVALGERHAGLAPEREQPLPERHAEPHQHPHQQRRRVGVERHEGRVHRPLLLHDAAVQHHQARHGLDAHQRRRRQLPRVVALVQPLRHRRELRRVRATRRRHRARSVRGRDAVRWWLAALAMLVFARARLIRCD